MKASIGTRLFFFFTMFILITISGLEGFSQTPLIEQKKLLFEKHITEAAEQCIGIPYGFGKTVKNAGALDNSHLFHLIYDHGAENAGMRYYGYAPLDKLMARTIEVAADEVRNGDLMVLKNGLAAMVYKTDASGAHHLIYVSHKRKRVISFNTQNVVYEVFWMKNLKGFYRLTPYNFFSK